MKNFFCNMFFFKGQQRFCCFSNLILVLLFTLTTACAHRINITPPLKQFEIIESSRIEKSVAYYISPSNLKKEVITPAGGGDDVKYLPYKESEPVLKAILSNIFVEVHSITSLNDAQFLASNNISYIFIPKINTNSSSRSSWIWPPSDFTVALDCKTTDSSGNIVWQTMIKSEAHMGLPDVHRDFSLAGKVAIEKVFSKLQNEIHEKFYDDEIYEYYSPQDAVDSFDKGDEYYSPQDSENEIDQNVNK